MSMGFLVGRSVTGNKTAESSKTAEGNITAPVITAADLEEKSMFEEKHIEAGNQENYNGSRHDEISRTALCGDLDEIKEKKPSRKNECEHYDGASVEDVFQERGKKLTDKTSFNETRGYLRQIRNLKRRVELLEERIGYNRDAGRGTTSLESDLEYARHMLKVKAAEVVEEISKLVNVNQEAVFIRRYVDLMTWDEIAMKLDFRMNSVLRYHGAGLPRLEEILLADGKIEMESDEDDASDCGQ